MAVARILDKRQAEITGRESDSSVEIVPGGPSEDKDSIVSTPATLPLFQPLLMNFLDHDAPVLGMDSLILKKHIVTLNNFISILENTSTSRTTFTNLVNLFTELIRNDVFSHDAYMCTLISRGDLQSTNNIGIFEVYKIF